MKILGISCYYHDAAIAIIEDGRILFAAQEERYTRIKNDENFPSNAIKSGLSFCKFNLNDFDAIIFYEKPFLKFERLLETYLHFAPKGLISFIKAMNTWTSKKLFIKSEIKNALHSIDENFDNKKVKLLFSEHHLSHAASAFYPSSFKEAAILTIDGVGEYTTTSLAIGNKNNIQILKEIQFPHSIGLLYSAITYYLGFKVNSDEYKVMGLAAYGNKDADETKQFIATIEKELIEIKEDGSYQLNMKNFSFPYSLRMVHDRKWETLFGIQKRKSDDILTQSHCNLAYAFQKITEKVVLLLCKEIRKITSSENLCLAGGVALNSVINGIIIEQQIFKNVFIQPASGDAGGALGAAFIAYHQYFNQKRNIQFPDAMQQSLLGNNFGQCETDELTTQHKNYIVCKNDDELCEKTVQHIADGKVIGWFQDRMEFGPRALGNRSIIADARNTEMQKHLNLKIKNRESFRPFAPAVLEEDAQHYFDFIGSSPYMLQVHAIKKEHLKLLPENYAELSLNEKLYTVKSTIPAVTHVDLSARIQTVNKEQHPLFWKLINTFKQQTGCSLIINTSFNIKDEPIVCTPKDAYNCFIKTNMDILVIEKTIFYK
ncbi:MAG: carbamoyltransferase N-terminal domain-containing protein [Chitinophagales bacterium]